MDDGTYYRKTVTIPIGFIVVMAIFLAFLIWG